MLHYVLVANGSLMHGDWLEEILELADVLVAIDGGYKHLQEFDHQPDLLIGDLDSIDPQQVDRLAEDGIEVLRHPERKDATDLELALQVARERGASQITLLGLVGSRWDQTLANLLLLADDKHAGIDIRVVDGPQAAYIVRAGWKFNMSGSEGDLVSLVPLHGDARGVRTTGLEYKLDGELLRYTSTRGISNVLLGPRASVELKDGVLLCLHVQGGEGALEKETLNA